MTFDEQVAALRGKVAPLNPNKKKADCTPEEWAAKLDYQKPRSKAWAKAHPEKYRAWDKAWRNTNPNKKRGADRAYRAANPEKMRAKAKARQKKRYRNDPVYRMMRNLRGRQRQFFKGTLRSLSMVRHIGCTQEFFRQHIASQLTGEMTLNNYGTVWHLDHIYPLSKASIVDNPVHFLAAANWRNLQPLPGPENLEKSDEVTPEAQALFDSLVQEFTRKVVAA